MPLYEYQCPNDGRFEVIRKFSDPPLTTCPTCGAEVQKLPSAPAIQFKGTGWYITDYARKPSGDGEAGRKSDEGQSGESKSSDSKAGEGKGDSGSGDSGKGKGKSRGAGKGGDSSKGSKDASSAGSGSTSKGGSSSGSGSSK